MLLLLITLIVTFHSRKYKKGEADEIIRKFDLEIENTDFLKELQMIKSGDFSGYISEIDHDVENVRQIIKDYKFMVKKYNKYNLQVNSPNHIIRKHALKMRDEYLQHILDDYRDIKRIKMGIISDEVYDEWKKQKI
jgi:predicted RNase H-like nuclease